MTTRGGRERLDCIIGVVGTCLSFRLRSLCAGAPAFVIPLAIYTASLGLGVDYWDTGELQTVPYILGIAHPSGFPAYVLIGWAWTHLFPVGDPATRMNLLSAVAMSAAALTLAGALVELSIEPVIASGAAIVFAVTRVPWGHATHADVHPLALAAVGAAFWAALHWGRTGSPRALPTCAVFAGLALGIHSGTILIVPGVVLAAFARRPTARRAAVAVGLGAVVVVAAYAYLPLRSAAVYAARLDPTLALGLPPGRPFWDTDHPAGPAGFWAEVAGSQFGTGRALHRLVDPSVLARLPVYYGRETVGDLAGGVILIALVGVVAVVRRVPLAGLGILGGSFLPVLFVLAYPAESDPERYFLPSYWAIGFFLGAGADVLSRGGLRTAPRSIVAVVGGLFVFVAGSNVYANRAAFGPRSNPSVQAFITRIVRDTPANAILVAPWTYATPLAYAAYVDHRLGGRIVLTGWPEDYVAQYPHWLANRPIVFVSDDPILEVAGLRVRETGDLLTPAPHLFDALEALQ